MQLYITASTRPGPACLKDFIVGIESVFRTVFKASIPRDKDARDKDACMAGRLTGWITAAAAMSCLIRSLNPLHTRETLYK